MGSRRRPRRFDTFVPWDGRIDEFDASFCGCHIAEGDVAFNSTTDCWIDLEATSFPLDAECVGSHVAFSRQWTVLKAVNDRGARALDAARQTLESLERAIGSSTWKPPVPKGVLGRHALLLAAAVDQKVVMYDHKGSQAAFAKWRDENSIVEGDGRSGFFDLTPDMLMPHQRASLFDVQKIAFLVEAAPGATNMELNDVPDL
jgi:hypothetical protein